MRLNLLLAVIIALAPMAIMPMEKTTKAAQTNEPKSSSVSPVEESARSESRIFKAYVIFLIFAGLGTAGGTVAVWRANNKWLCAGIWNSP
jgi:NADH:ubiquinone oxidoreductase subunit H